MRVKPLLSRMNGDSRCWVEQGLPCAIEEQGRVQQRSPRHMSHGHNELRIHPVHIATLLKPILAGDSARCGRNTRVLQLCHSQQQ